MDDEQFGFAATVPERAEMRERVCADHVERFERPGLRGVHHLRSGEAGFRWWQGMPMLLQGFGSVFVVEIRVAGKAIG